MFTKTCTICTNVLANMPLPRKYEESALKQFRSEHQYKINITTIGIEEFIKCPFQKILINAYNMCNYI